MGVTEEGTREVLGIYNSPVESATGWGNMFDVLRERGVEQVGLLVADGLSGLDRVIGEKFPGAAFQRYMLARVRHGDKRELADDLRETELHRGDGHGCVEGTVRKVGKGLPVHP